MTFASSFGRVFSPTFQPKSQAAAVASSWWLAGGIDAANCIAAYQAKGAASYAASLTDLSGSSNNAGETASTVGWDATNGWKFDGTNNFISSGVAPTQYTSMIIRFSDVTQQVDICGITGTSPRYYLRLLYEQRMYAYGSSYAYVNGFQSSGVMAMTGGDAGYFNGTKECDLSGTWTNTSTNILIGKGYAATAIAFNVQAFALYNATLTPTQIGSLSTAMAAL